MGGCGFGEKGCIGRLDVKVDSVFVFLWRGMERHSAGEFGKNGSGGSGLGTDQQTADGFGESG